MWKSIKNYNKPIANRKKKINLSDNIILTELNENISSFQLTNPQGFWLEAEEDEAVFIQEAFKTIDITKTEQAILDLLKTDPKATPEVIAAAIKQTKSYMKCLKWKFFVQIFFNVVIIWFAVY